MEIMYFEENSNANITRFVKELCHITVVFHVRKKVMWNDKSILFLAELFLTTLSVILTASEDNIKFYKYVLLQYNAVCLHE